MSLKNVIVIGGGLAGLSSAVALAEAGHRVRLLEKRSHLGGRAASYVLPGGEHVDNCQHVTLGCCTNLEDFYRRGGAVEKIRFFDRLLFSTPDWRAGTIESTRVTASTYFGKHSSRLALAIALESPACLSENFTMAARKRSGCGAGKSCCAPECAAFK